MPRFRTIAAAVAVFLASAAVAHADPITAIVTAISTAISSVATAAAGLVSFASLGAFLGSPIGSLVLGLGLQLLVSPFLKRKTQSASVEASKINVRVAEPDRWIAAGLMRMGGGVVFAEFDADGNFWYVCVHSDSILTSIDQRYFDDIPIDVDVDGVVQTNDFCLDDEFNLYTEGDKRTYFKIWTSTYSASDPTPPAIAELALAFPGVDGWTSDHKLVGTTFSVTRVRAVGAEHRYKIFKWRGPVGLGEPAVSIAGRWSLVYDPRDNTQILGNPTTYKPTRNGPLIWAWFRTHRYGRGKNELTDINWSQMAIQADVADREVLSIDGNTYPWYQCGTAIPESKERAEAEQEILASFDGQIVFDNEGKAWARAGYYYAPTLTLSRNRDIMAMESVEATNGESETQGVIVRYIDPTAKYVTQPSAAWRNPLYYVEGETPRYLTIDILTCQNHNQAMRLAKAFGERSQPAYKILPTCGLRGLRATRERIIDILYDNTFAGDHEVVTQVEVDDAGIFCGVGLVPVNPDRWTLLAGEEKAKPVYAEIELASEIDLPTSVVIAFVGGVIKATFDAVPREDYRYVFEYKLSTDADEAYQPMLTEMEFNYSQSIGVAQNKSYHIRWKTVTTAGKASAWVSPVYTLSTAILTLTGTPVITGTVGVAYTSWTFGASGGVAPYLFVDLYGRLPPGLTLNSSTGLVSGTPTLAGTYANILFRAGDSDGAIGNFAAFTITIAP